MDEHSSSNVEIVIINWNMFVDTDECLQSLAEINYPNVGITLVDNNSTDDSFARLAEKYPQHTFIESETNRGFSGGNNLGIRDALSRDVDYVLLLNNDTVVESDFLTPLVERAERSPNAGIVTGKIYVADTDPPEIWCAGGEIDWTAGCGVYYGHEGLDFGAQDTGQFDTEQRVDLASGCLMLVPTAVFDDVGLLPEQYFFGGEEWDFSVSVRKAGYSIWYVPNSVIWHKVSESFNQNFHDPWREYNSERIKLLFLSRQLNQWQWLTWYLVHLVYICTVGVYQRFELATDHPNMDLRDLLAVKFFAEWDHIRRESVTKADINRVQSYSMGDDAL